MHAYHRGFISNNPKLEHHKCPPVKWINELWNIHKMQYYYSLKKSKPWYTHEPTCLWMDLRGIVLNEKAVLKRGHAARFYLYNILKVTNESDGEQVSGFQGSGLGRGCASIKKWVAWCWERSKAGGERDHRGWGGCMASPTQWTWVWVNSRSWRWTGRPGVLQFMRSQRVRQDWVTELNWTKCITNT